MTNRIALTLAALVAAAIAVDLLAFGGAGSLFAARKMADFVEYTAFWR